MRFEKREAPTRAKHQILEAYIGAWAGIICNGLRSRVFSPGAPQHLETNLIYLDGFAGPGRYGQDADKPDQDELVWGSPTMAMRVLEEVANKRTTERLSITTTGILIEKDVSHHRELLQNLAASNLATPIQQCEGFASKHLGSIAVIQGDFRDHVDGIVGNLRAEDFLFGFIDPFGPSAPLQNVATVVERMRTDTLIFFPSHEVDWRGGSARKPPSQRQPQDQDNVNRIDGVFGTDQWQEIAKLEDLSVDEREDRYAALYAQQLRQKDPELVVKSIALRFSTMDRPFYQLFLTTRDPFGAFRMNEILRETELEKHWMRWRDREARLEQEKQEQGVLELDLNVPQTQPPAPEVEKPSSEEVRSAVEEVLRAPESCSYRALLQRLADTPYLQTEVNQALRTMRTEGAIDFEGLSKESVIEVKLSR